MKLEQLVHVVEVANTQSISKAASNLLLSQPGLSASIKQLEYELGTELFTRSKKGVEVTSVGSSFVMYAKKVLEQVQEMETLCKEQSTPIRPTLSVAACHFRFASAAVAMLLRKHADDGARFVVRSGVSSDCIDWVADGICDIGLVYYRAEEEKEFKKLMQLKQLRYENIYQAGAQVVIGKGHPLYNTDVTEIDAQELLKYPMVAHDQTTAKDYFRSVFLHSKMDNLRTIITDRAALYDILELSDSYTMGLSNDIVYQNIPRPHGTRNLKVVGSSSAATRNVAWIASANVDFMPLAKELTALLTALCTETDFKQNHPEYY
ncbi:MAG: LysR family transcriptional regulator [Oscillospiraceae bacterium]|nr:LysR family transcriptional regulator [Oscillospiraceae bacterium]